MTQDLKKLIQSQSLNITKGVLKNVGSTEKININFAPVMIVNEKSEPERPHLNDLQEMLWVIIESLPHPKFQNLRKLAMKTCLEKIPRKKDVSIYLQMQRTYISQQKTSLNNDPLFLEAPSKEDTDDLDTVR